MLPIGLGKTDDLGFLRQGVYVEDINAQKTQIYTHNNNSFIFVPPKVLPYAVTMEEMPYSFTPQKLNPFHSDHIQLINQTSDFYFDANGILTTQHDFLKKDWRRQLLLSGQYTFELRTRQRIPSH